jgi:PAS domain S-box-containing protein
MTRGEQMENKLREREVFSTSLLTHALTPILVINLDRSIRYVNPAFENLTGFSSHELIGRKPPYPWWPEADLATIHAKFEESFSKGWHGFEQIFQKKNGEQFWVRTTGNPIIDEDTFKYYLVNWADITELKRAEELLRKAHEELEDLVKERTGELEKTNEELRTEIVERERVEGQLRESKARAQALNEHILTMLMVVSHDMRSPLVSIGATLKLLVRGLYGSLDESVRNTVTDLYGRVTKLIGIVEDCLGKSSSVTGEVEFERSWLDLREDIIDPVLDELFPEIEGNEIVIDNRLGAIPADQILIKANKIWLKVVFRNLFSNAIKYGGKGSRLAFGFEQCGCQYKLNVFNSGNPIPEEFRAQLFNKFPLILESGKGAMKGIGLGLYLIKEIIQKHGGTIWYEAKEDGSNFVFTLPCEQPPVAD